MYSITQPGRGVSLRIEIQDQNLLPDGRKRSSEVDRRRRLADAALLVGQSQYTGAPGGSPGSKLSISIGSGFRRARAREFSVLILDDPTFSGRIQIGDAQDPTARIGLTRQGVVIESPVFQRFRQFSLTLITLGKEPCDTSFQQRRCPCEQFRQRRQRSRCHDIDPSDESGNDILDARMMNNHRKPR